MISAMERAKMYKEYHAGAVTVQELAEQYGVDTDTIDVALKNEVWTVERERTGRAWNRLTKEDADAIMAAYMGGESLNSLAKLYPYDRKTIMNYVNGRTHYDFD